MIYVDNVSKSFGKASVLSGITVEFPERECVVIVGVNGSGKTTLLNSIAGLSEVSSGVISIDGSDLVGTKRYQEQIFYIPSDFYLPDFMTGREYASFVFSRYRDSHPNIFHDISIFFGIDNDLGKMIGAYSFGMKKKLQIAIAACVGTKYILIDEGLTGLDFETTLLAQKLLARLVKTTGIILVTHDMDTVRQFPNNIFLLKKGTLNKFEGSVEDIVNVVSKDSEYEVKSELLEKLPHSA